jgi:hypothetical protein
MGRYTSPAKDHESTLSIIEIPSDNTSNGKAIFRKANTDGALLSEFGIKLSSSVDRVNEHSERAISDRGEGVAERRQAGADMVHKVTKFFSHNEVVDGVRPRRDVDGRGILFADNRFELVSSEQVGLQSLLNNSV